MNEYTIGLLALLLSPVAGGFLFGVDRKLTARLQNRIGPPITQPFYDVLKLFGKEPAACNSFLAIAATVYLVTHMLGVLMLALGQDLLVLLFVVALGTVMLILGAFSVKSPYSQLGAQRELIQMLGYEPALVLMVVAVYLHTGSFSVGRILELNKPLLFTMPLFVVTQTIVLAIKLHKSPFDVSACHHAHQELVRGLYTEYSGPILGLIEIGHFYEIVLLLGFVWLLFHTVWWAGLLLALSSLIAVILVDNVTSRLTWRWLVSFSWLFGAGLALMNLAFLYIGLRTGG